MAPISCIDPPPPKQVVSTRFLQMQLPAGADKQNKHKQVWEILVWPPLQILAVKKLYLVGAAFRSASSKPTRICTALFE